MARGFNRNVFLGTGLLLFGAFFLGVPTLTAADSSEPAVAGSTESTPAEKEKQREQILQQMKFLSGSLGALPQPPKLNEQIKLPGVGDAEEMPDAFKMRAIFGDEFETESIFDDEELIEEEDEIDRELEKLIEGL